MTSLEQHLTDHEYLDTFDGWESCECGWREEIERRSETGSVFTHAAHVADTWRATRTVRTVEELDALPTGAIIREGGDALHVDHGPRGEWTGTATVLHILHGRLTIGDTHHCKEARA